MRGTRGGNKVKALPKKCFAKPLAVVFVGLTPADGACDRFCSLPADRMGTRLVHGGQKS